MAIGINITRQIPIVKGFVKVPGAERQYDTTLTVDAAVALIAGCRVVRIAPNGTLTSLNLISVGSSQVFDMPGHDFYLELPAFEVAPDTDYFQVLRDAAEAA